jgi:hypothetical protein
VYAAITPSVQIPLAGKDFSRRFLIFVALVDFLLHHDRFGPMPLAGMAIIIVAVVIVNVNLPTVHVCGSGSKETKDTTLAN